MQNENTEKHVTPAAAPTAKPVSSEPDDFTPRYLDPTTLTFTRSEVGTAQLEIRKEACYLRVVVRRLMPPQQPESIHLSRSG